MQFVFFPNAFNHEPSSIANFRSRKKLHRMKWKQKKQQKGRKRDKQTVEQER